MVFWYSLSRSSVVLRGGTSRFIARAGFSEARNSGRPPAQASNGSRSPELHPSDRRMCQATFRPRPAPGSSCRYQRRSPFVSDHHRSQDVLRRSSLRQALNEERQRSPRPFAGGGLGLRPGLPSPGRYCAYAWSVPGDCAYNEWDEKVASRKTFPLARQSHA